MAKSSLLSSSVAMFALLIAGSIVSPIRAQSRLLASAASGGSSGRQQQQQQAVSGAERILFDSFDRLSGGQFVELADPLMDGKLRGIIEQIKHKYSPEALSRFSATANLPTRSFLEIFNTLSGGEVANALQESFPTLFVNKPERRSASLDTMSGLSLGYAKKKSLDAMSGVSFGAPTKRYAPASNFDEIDHSGFSHFVKRRAGNFDEMDRAGFSGFAKRGSDFDEIDRDGFSNFAKRRSDFDEIDRAGFSGFAKRRSDFDEIDRAGFSGFAKRFNFDELDRNGFTGFMSKRSKPFALGNYWAIIKNRQQQQQQAQQPQQPQTEGENENKEKMPQSSEQKSETAVVGEKAGKA